MMAQAYNVPITLANETNKANGTYNYNMPMAGFKHCSISWSLTGTITIKIYATNDVVDDLDNATWFDVTTDTIGAASSTVSDFAFLDTNVCCQGLRVEVTTAGGGTDDYVIKASRSA